MVLPARLERAALLCWRHFIERARGESFVSELIDVLFPRELARPFNFLFLEVLGFLYSQPALDSEGMHGGYGEELLIFGTPHGEDLYFTLTVTAEGVILAAPVSSGVVNDAATFELTGLDLNSDETLSGVHD